MRPCSSPIAVCREARAGLNQTSTPCVNQHAVLEQIRAGALAYFEHGCHSCSYIAAAAGLQRLLNRATCVLQTCPADCQQLLEPLAMFVETGLVLACADTPYV